MCYEHHIKAGECSICDNNEPQPSTMPDVIWAIDSTVTEDSLQGDFITYKPETLKSTKYYLENSLEQRAKVAAEKITNIFTTYLNHTEAWNRSASQIQSIILAALKGE